MLFVAGTDAENTSPALVLAYTGAYAVGAVGSYLVLRRLLGGLETPRLVRFLVRALLAAGLATAVAGGAAWLLDDLLGDDRSKLESLALLASVATIDGVLYLLLARAFRLVEVTELVETVTRRLPVRRRT